MDVRQLTIAGVLENVPRACDFVVGAARDAGLNEKAVYHCHLAVDETCTNIVEHGYVAHGTEGVIEISCRVDQSRFVISITDDSTPFDPLSVPDPQRGLPPDERAPGGWGIFFIKRFMDDVDYHLVGGRNRLVMKKVINAPHGYSSSTDASEPLQISISSLAKNLRVLSLSGRLDSITSRALQAALNSELSAGNCRLIVEMAHVEYVSSAGIKVLVSAWQRAREQRGDLVLAALRPRVREVLEIVGLDLVFALVDTTAQAAALIPSR